MNPIHEMLFFLGLGLFVALFLLLIPKPVLRRIMKLPGLTPNWVTVWGLIVTWVGIIFYFGIHALTGFLLVVAGLVLDRLDGKMASIGEPHKREGQTDRWKQFTEELNHPGATETGKWLDPLADKLRLPPLLLIFSFMGYYPVGLAVGILLIDVFSTIMRPPFQLIPERYLRSASATAFGKLKVTFQFLVLILILPADQQWFPLTQNTFMAVLLLAIAFGLLSVLSRIQFTGILAPINRIVDGFNAPFRHDM